MFKMKKYFLIFSILIASYLPLVAHSSNTDNQLEKWLSEYQEIFNQWQSSYWANKHPMPKKILASLTKCSKTGNIVCSNELGNYYYQSKKDYNAAFPYLLNSAKYLERKSLKEVKKSKFIPVDAVESLASMYLRGEGVLQDLDKAIHYGKLSAQYGEPYSAYVVHRAYLQKSTNRNNSTKESLTNSIASYAWGKVAIAMGVTKQFAEPDKGKSNLETSLYSLLYDLDSANKTKLANSMAFDICKAIEGCNT